MVMFSFILFRQETEYELRIGDWSSVVCSSDLSALHDRAIDAHLITLDAELRVVVSERLLRLDGALATSAFARVSGRKITLPERFHPDLDLLGRHRQRFEQRSEEHTSELQSLMRISYAVFCLKKKKTR